jgi:hypothetical protein
MKKLVLILLTGTCALSAYTQGRAIFASDGIGVGARFALPSDHPLGSNLLNGTTFSQFRADLFWTPGTTTVGVLPSSLVNQGMYLQAFSTVGAAAGYFQGGTKTVTGWVSGEIVAQVRVWDTSFGNYDVLGASWF